MIPFVDLKQQNDALRPEFEAALARVLDQGAFALGPEVEAFEQAFAAYCGAAHAVAMNNGTSALHLALLAAGVGPGDEVVTTPFSFIATSSAICYANAKPVYADIDPLTFNLDPAAAAAAITPRSKAILPVHLYGQPADMAPLRELAARHGIALIEDAAQAHGAEYQGQRAGSLGDFGCFSFYPTKNLGALGEGGLVTTQDAAHAHRLRLLRDWGTEEKYIHSFLAFNARMEGIQGAMLRAKLPYLERFTEARRAHAARYAESLPAAGVAPVVEAAGRRHVYHVYSVRVPAAERARVQGALKAAGIGTGIVYPRPLHLQPALAHLGYREGQFPEAERAAREVLCLPMYPELAKDAPEQVAAALGRALRA